MLPITILQRVILQQTEITHIRSRCHPRLKDYPTMDKHLGTCPHRRRNNDRHLFSCPLLIYRSSSGIVSQLVADIRSNLRTPSFQITKLVSRSSSIIQMLLPDEE